MIDAHIMVRLLAVTAALSIPVGLLIDQSPSPPTAGPVFTLNPPPPAPLPGRSLFAPSPITGEAAAPAAEGPPRLVGIAGRLPDDAVALLQFGDGATRGLRPGESAEGWTVAAIAADRVRLSRAGRDHVEILPPTS